MTLLRSLPFEGYPTPFVVARLRARRSAAAGIEPSLSRTGDEGPNSWKGFLTRSAWCYRLLNPPLRDRFRPVVLFFEIRTLAMALRLKAGGETLAALNLCRCGLLSEEVQGLLGSEKALPAVLAELALLSRTDLPQLAWEPQPEAAYSDQLRGLETALLEAVLQQGASGRPALPARFLSRLIDWRNLLLLIKHLRWKLAAPPLLPGGTGHAKRLLQLFERNDLGGANRLLGLRAATTEGAALERALLEKLDADLRRLARNGSSVAMILSFFWQSYLGTRLAQEHGTSLRSDSGEGR